MSNKKCLFCKEIFAKDKKGIIHLKENGETTVKYFCSREHLRGYLNGEK